MFASTEQNKEKIGFHGERLQIETITLDISYSCYAIRVFLTDFIEVFLCKSISANVKDLQYFAISIFQEFNQALHRTGLLCCTRH